MRKHLALLINALILAAFGGYFCFFEEPWLRYQNLPFPVLAEVRVGGVVKTQTERCNDSGVAQQYTTTRTIKNILTRKEYELSNTQIEIFPGCHRVVSERIQIPDDAAPGQYMIRGAALVKGTLVNHSVQWYTEPFDVLEKK